MVGAAVILLLERVCPRLLLLQMYRRVGGFGFEGNPAPTKTGGPAVVKRMLRLMAGYRRLFA